MPRPLKTTLIVLAALVLLSGGPFTLFPTLVVFLVWRQLKLRNASRTFAAAKRTQRGR